MGYFYFDDSKHSTAGFILGAFVYSESDLDYAVRSALINCGFHYNDEYKSSLPMTDIKNRQLRKAISTIIEENHCQIGLVISPYENVIKNFTSDSLNCLSSIIEKNRKHEKHTVFFDEGLVNNRNAIKNILKTDTNFRNCEIFVEQSSQIKRGIQVADFVAHQCSIMLKEQMGLITKIIRIDGNGGYPPGTEISLGFELWASIRYSFFIKNASSLDSHCKNTGLYISSRCTPDLRRHISARFKTIYLGCIH